MFEIRRYTSSDKAQWDAFIAQSKNGTFLFFRNYMDYHADRFVDHSLMIYYKSSLYALLPANVKGDTLYSHQGLTYGGLLMSDKCKTAEVRDAVRCVNDYLYENGIRRVVYKHIPWVYCGLPSEEDLFALTNVCQATVLYRDVASVVVLSDRLPFSTLRRRGMKKALTAGLQVKEQTVFEGFWHLLEDNLWNRFHARPVHSLTEIQLLHSRFPNNIRLFVVEKENELLGGTVLYVCGKTVKTQYISANEKGKQMHVLDLLFDQLLQKFADEGMSYFDFGTSNKDVNDDLNDSLIFQKEGFGGRAVCYDTYEWKLQGTRQ